jgi:integrase
LRQRLFTGCRLSEILELRWPWVNLERKRLELPDSKTGAKLIFLNEPAIEVLSALPRLEANPFVIAGAKAGQHLINLQKPRRRIRKAANLPDVRIHDLRHNYASVAAGLGEGLPMIGKLLGHSQAQTTHRYAHLAADPVIRANERVGAAISSAMTRGMVLALCGPGTKEARDLLCRSTALRHIAQRRLVLPGRQSPTGDGRGGLG